jgi:hypothetical protein
MSEKEKFLRKVAVLCLTPTFPERKGDNKENRETEGV